MGWDFSNRHLQVSGITPARWLSSVWCHCKEQINSTEGNICNLIIRGNQLANRFCTSYEANSNFQQSPSIKELQQIQPLTYWNVDYLSLDLGVGVYAKRIQLIFFTDAVSSACTGKTSGARLEYVRHLVHSRLSNHFSNSSSRGEERIPSKTLSFNSYTR